MDVQALCAGHNEALLAVVAACNSLDAAGPAKAKAQRKAVLAAAVHTVHCATFEPALDAAVEAAMGPIVQVGWVCC